MELFDSEEWRPVVGYEGLYEVSNLGRVKALERSVKSHNQVCEFYRTYPERLISMHRLDRNYYQVFICKDGVSKGYLIHRLVAEAFIPNPENKPEVNHKDRNPANNCVSNLEWVTKLENIRDAINKGWDPTLSRKGKKNSEYHNRRISETHKGKIVTAEQRQHLHEGQRNRFVKCRCIETGVVYECMQDAERELNLWSGGVSNSIQTGHAIHGLHFERI